jgi:hypothetical protein
MIYALAKKIFSFSLKLHWRSADVFRFRHLTLLYILNEAFIGGVEIRNELRVTQPDRTEQSEVQEPNGEMEP